QRLAVLNKAVYVKATKDNRSLGEMRKGVRLDLGAGSGSGLGPVFAKRLHPLLRRRVAELDKDMPNLIDIQPFRADRSTHAARHPSSCVQAERQASSSGPRKRRRRPS